MKTGWQFRLLQIHSLVLTLIGPNFLAQGKRDCPVFMEREKSSCGCHANADATGPPASISGTAEHLAGARPPNLWPGGIVYYDVSKQFDEWYRDKIVQVVRETIGRVGKNYLEIHSMKKMAAELCLRDRYILFEKTSFPYCFGPTGMSTKTNATVISLNQEICIYDTDIALPLLLALGMQSEHNRSDRDKHVTIVFDELYTPMCFDFKARTVPDVTESLPYDTASIMHYYACIASCRGNYEILDLDGKPIGEMGIHANITDLDVAKLRALYPADKKVAYTPGPCDGPSSRQGDRSEPTLLSSEDSDTAVASMRPWQWPAMLTVVMATRCSISSKVSF